MIATPVINQMLFFLSMLFGINVPMIGQQAVVDIDFTGKKGSITYHQVVTSEAHAHLAKAALKELHEATTFNNRYDFMELVDKTFTVEQDYLQVKVQFSYENEQLLLDRLGFQKNEEDGGLIYKILERETFVKSNGDHQDTLVKWPSETFAIHMEIAGKSLEEEEKAASVSLARYWKE